MSNLGFHCHDLDALDSVVMGNGLRRTEFYNLPPDDLPRLERLIRKHNLAWSIHTPLVQLDWYPNPPTWSYLCDPDGDRRELTLKMTRMTVEQAEDLGAEYVVVHLPAPTDHSTPADGQLEDAAKRSCEALAELSVKRGVPVHVEGVGQTPLIRGDFLVGLLKEFDPLRYCFDTAHSNLASQYNDIDMYELHLALLPYLGSMHLWNTRDREDYVKYRHVPVHPSQSAEDGWVDIPRILSALDSKGDTLPVIFESEPSYPADLGGHDYREGVEWVKGLLAT